MNPLPTSVWKNAVPATGRRQERVTMKAGDSSSLLLVDDEPELCTVLAEYLTRHGFDVRTAADAAAARAAIDDALPSVVVLDINMPGENGLSLARWLREHHRRLGIVLLTSMNEPVDRVVGLELGADDYVSKPFEPRELIARVRAVQRRLDAASDPPSAASAADPAASSGHRARFGACELRLDERRLLGGDGREIPVSASEFDLLALFARSPHRPLNRDQIMELAHHRGWDVFDRSIDMRVMRLRRKIELNPNRPEVIKTIRNVGYVYVPPHD